MNFLTPAAFALTLLIPVVIAMYLLKLRRSEQVISSVYLWRRMVRDVEANAPWQRLRRNLLLFLQLLFLIALILALARPFTWVEGASAQAVILILDNSASMNAVDIEPNRLEAAKTRARQLVSSLPEDAIITVISASESAQVLASSSQDRRQVLQSIENIRAGSGSSDLTTALQLASAIAARQTDVEVIILSDGRTALPDRISIKARVRYLPFGLSGENQAISLLNVGPAPGSGGLTVFAQVSNYGSSSANRRLELYSDGLLVNAFDLEIPAGEHIPVLAEDLPHETSIVEARLTQPGCSQPCLPDALPLDDHVWAVYRSGEPTKVALITEGNLFLEVALPLLPNLEVTILTPTEYELRYSAMPESSASTPETFDLTVFDYYIPPTIRLPNPENEADGDRNQRLSETTTNELPSGNLLFISPPHSTSIFTITGAVDGPNLRPFDVEDPLLTHVNLGGLNVLTAAHIPLPDWARTVIAGDVDGGSFPMLFAGEVNGRRLAVLSFDLHHSDLPLQIAFPLLLSNLTGWLAPGKGADLPAYVSPGTPISLTLPLGVETAWVTRPDGSRTYITPDNDRMIFADTHQLGLYQVSWGEADRLEFAVNLFSPQESDIKPVDNLPIIGIYTDEGEEQTGFGRQEWWRMLAFFALAVMFVEWLVYHRATLARLHSNARALIKMPLIKHHR